MHQFWKRSGVLATASKGNLFSRARFKLTLLYVFIITIIVLGFSVFLYQGIQRNLMDANEDDFAGVESHQHFVKNTIALIENDLIFIDLVIIIISAGLSYVLAGKTLKPIQESVEAQKVFAANASHELRTPLAVMKSDIEVLSRNKYPTKELIDKTFQSNLEEIERMSGIVENLLLLARSDNNVRPVLTKLDAGILLKAMIEKMRSVAHAKNIKLVFKNSSSILINGNSALLERAILNIIQNSVEHTSKDGFIKIEAIRDNYLAVIRIADTGSGIDEKDLPHVFTRFYKSETSTGSGLGLSIVKDIINQHNGYISIESKKGIGTTITIRIPLA